MQVVEDVGCSLQEMIIQHTVSTNCVAISISVSDVHILSYPVLDYNHPNPFSKQYVVLTRFANWYGQIIHTTRHGQATTRPLLLGHEVCDTKGCYTSHLTLIYPAHFEDVPCQSGVNHIYEG